MFFTEQKPKTLREKISQHIMFWMFMLLFPACPGIWFLIGVQAYYNNNFIVAGFLGILSLVIACFWYFSLKNSILGNVTAVNRAG